LHLGGENDLAIDPLVAQRWDDPTGLG